MEWPARTTLSAIYALLIKHASQEQVNEIDKALSGGSGSPDELASILDRAIALEADEQ